MHTERPAIGVTNDEVVIGVNVKSKGRVPFLKSVKHYNISIFEIIQKWREYKVKVSNNVPPVKELKMKALIINMI